MKIYKNLLVAAGLLAFMAAPALAYEPGTFVLRGGVGTIDPKSNNLSFVDGEDSVSLDVRSGTSMTLTGTYMFNENWALDILAAYPFEHDIKANVDLGQDSGTVKIADTKQLPPTLSVQYHFAPDRDFQPYAGVGLNWTTFFSTDLVPAAIDDEVDCISLKDSFGVAAQLGGDWKIGERTVVNFDVRWIDIDSELRVGGPAIEGKQKVGTVEIDPWVYSLNLGYHF